MDNLSAAMSYFDNIGYANWHSGASNPQLGAIKGDFLKNSMLLLLSFDNCDFASKSHLRLKLKICSICIWVENFNQILIQTYF